MKKFLLLIVVLVLSLPLLLVSSTAEFPRLSSDASLLQPGGEFRISVSGIPPEGELVIWFGSRMSPTGEVVKGIEGTKHLEGELVHLGAYPVMTKSFTKTVSVPGSAKEGDAFCQVIHSSARGRKAFSNFIQFTVKSIPEKRSFHLGMNAHPHAYTDRDISETYQLIGQHSDLILHHLDFGVPWPEALAAKPFHPNVEKDLDRRVKERRKGQKVYLAVAPQASDRTELAMYWGEDQNLNRPGVWKDRDFGHPDVFTAYMNYLEVVIKRLKPDYLAYAIEATDNFRAGDGKFDEFVRFSEKVYKALKLKHPSLPVFVTLATVNQNKSTAESMEMAKKILPHSDYVAISTYPWWQWPGSSTSKTSDPAVIVPEKWFSKWAQLDPKKPFAISETSYLGEDLRYDPWKLSVKGSERWQAQYVQRMFEELNGLDAEFIAWFIPRDYDHGWNWLVKNGFVDKDDLGQLWLGTGLVDENGRPKSALKVWDAWLDLPVK